MFDADEIDFGTGPGTSVGSDPDDSQDHMAIADSTSFTGVSNADSLLFDTTALQHMWWQQSTRMWLRWFSFLQ